MPRVRIIDDRRNIRAMKTDEQDLYEFTNALYEKARLLPRLLKGDAKTKAEEIVVGLLVLKGTIKKIT